MTELKKMNREKMKEFRNHKPVDAVLVDREEAAWISVIANLSHAVAQSEDQLIVNKAFLEFAQSKLALIKSKQEVK